jgi:hypothetical protein
MKKLKEYIHELEVNYHDLVSIYENGENNTGKIETQLLFHIFDHFQFKKSWEENTDTNLRPKLFVLKNKFRKLLENDTAVRSIAKIICFNIYNVNGHGVNKVRIHLYEQYRKIEFVIAEESSEVESEIILSGNNVKGNLTKIFFTLLGDINFKGKLIFNTEIENFDQFKIKFTYLMQKKFSKIKQPIVFEVGKNSQYIAHYIITELAKAIGINDDFTPFEKVIQINTELFNAVSRNSSWTRQIKPRVEKKISDPDFDSVISQVTNILNTII